MAGEYKITDDNGNEFEILADSFTYNVGQTGTQVTINGQMTSSGSFSQPNWGTSTWPSTTTPGATFLSPGFSPSYYPDFGGTCALGHVFEELIEYVDGQVVAHCTECGCRAVLPGVPGGISLLRLKTLIGTAMSLNDESLPEEKTQVLTSLCELWSQLEREEVALVEARSLLEIAHKQFFKGLNTESTDEVDGD